MLLIIRSVINYLISAPMTSSITSMITAYTVTAILVSVDDGTVIYNRLCYEYDSPATYYPAGCYTVFNGQKSPTIEVCND